MIFVQIAAYRDPETLPTILDCIAKAKYPKDLRFGLCWQRHEKDHSLLPLKSNPQFRIDDVPWHESLGLCWARSRIQNLYEGENYTLQIDSHHRFGEHWDARLMDFMELTGSASPILTSYAGVYNPATNEKRDDGPFMMVGKKFSEYGTIPFFPHTIPNWRSLEKPVRARFVSGHFFFAPGRHCEDYRYDPSLYFAGDEISLSIRSYTLGYDLFHPHRTLIWHEYTRQGRVKHWDDHVVGNEQRAGLAWHERDAISKRRLRKLLKEEENDEDLSGYDLGRVRSHRDYELYAGINFSSRTLHRDTVIGIEPPCLYTNEVDWEQSFLQEHHLEVKWAIADLGDCSDLRFVYFGIEDAKGNVLHRFDADAQSPEAAGQTTRKKFEIFAATQPAKLIIWPFSHSRGWLNKVAYAI